MKIVGIDPSLSATGVAVVEDGDVSRIRVVGLKRSSDSIAGRLERINRISERVLCEAAPPWPDLAVIEAPAYGSRTGSQHDRSGLWFAIVGVFVEFGVPVVEVPPACRAKYATGRGNAPKDEVLASVVRRLAHTVANNNEADALILAAMGSRWLDEPIDDPMPERHLHAMTRVRWPDVVEAGL